MDRLDAHTPHGRLAVRRFGNGLGPVVCLHGFSLHGGMFAPIAAASRCRVLAPDLPGHGASRIEPVDLETTLAVLDWWMRDLAEPVTVLGYSQGGRIALHLACRRPELISRLVIVSASPGLPDEERHDRSRDDAALADRIERIGLSTFLDEWLAHPLVGTKGLDDATASADRRLREENTASGLASALRGLGQGAVPRVDVSTIRQPILWITGSCDARYTEMAMHTARAQLDEVVVVAETGHNVVLEAPEVLGDLVNHAVTRRPSPS